MIRNDCANPLPPEVLRGLDLFNTGKYFEAHEALENGWRAETGEIRVLYQAILQVAVTYLHIERGNFEGAVRVAARALPKLEKLPEACCGVDVAGLRDDFLSVMEHISEIGAEHIHGFDNGVFKAIKYVVD